MDLVKFVNVTEDAAIAAFKWKGLGDKNSADGAAVTAMRKKFNSIDFNGVVVIGEGEKDDAPMLYSGEKIGTGVGGLYDVAVDPLECTTNLAMGKPDSMSVMAISRAGGLRKLPGTYMDQICVRVKCDIDIKLGAGNVAIVAKALGKKVSDVVVAVQDRERNAKLISDLRATGCRIRLFDHGSISMGVGSAISCVDMMMGISGAPEAVITAAALQSVGGSMQAILKPHNEKMINDAKLMGINDGYVFSIDELAHSESIFIATGISDGPILKGIEEKNEKLTTHSLVIRDKKIVRIETIHEV